MTRRLARFGFILLVSLCAGGLSFLWTLHQKRGDAQIEITAAHAELELALATLSIRMAAVASALENTADISPDTFTAAYDKATQSASRVHERAMALMPAFQTPQELGAVVDRLAPAQARAGYPGFSIFPTDETDPLFPVIFVEPAEARENVLGYNLASSPERRAAGRLALARRSMQVSAPVALSQDGGTDAEVVVPDSFLLLYPVFLQPDALGPAVAEGPRHALLGAGVTPGALFQNHVQFSARKELEIAMGIDGQLLSVTLGPVDPAELPRFALERDMTMPDIRINDIVVPVQVSAFWHPRVADVFWPGIAALAAGALAFLGLSLISTRRLAQQALVTALAQREAELREAYRIQARSQRIEALGRLVGGVAHDFNNILSIILGNLELIKEETPAHDTDPLLDEAVKATFRGAHLTRQLLSVGRRSHLQPHRVSVPEILQESTSMLSRVLPESIDLTTAADAGLWPVEVDPDGLQNALLNLALNARDAMEGRGKLIIEASNTRATRDYLDERPDVTMPPGRYVAISVTDTGPGIPAEVLDRVFEPFYTTKSATEGSGLGLPSVLGFCQQTGGTCRIYSELGVGTTVRMLLPAAETATSASQSATSAREGPGTGHILLAEDEDAVARVLTRHLETAGYDVTRVGTGDAASEKLSGGTPFDLLISDLVMPGHIQGAELARQAESARPGLPILLISGYPQEAAIEGNGVATRHPVLTKPVPREDLLKTVRRLLAAGRG